MFSQQVASNLSESPGKAAVVPDDHCDDWESAERYYCNGRFRYIAAVIETDPVERIASAAGADDTPAVYVSTIVQADEPQQPSEPKSAVVEPIDQLEVEAEFPTPEAITSISETVADTPEQDPSILDTPEQQDTPAAADADVVFQAESEPQPAEGEIDVLPLPLDDPAEDMPEFGVFADDSDAPKSDLTVSGGSTSPEQQYTQSDRYGIPAGHSMRYVDPRDLVRQRAVEKAENRSRRIEARKWMGYDPLRPSVTAVPYTTVPATRPTLLVIPVIVRGGQ